MQGWVETHAVLVQYTADKYCAVRGLTQMSVFMTGFTLLLDASAHSITQLAFELHATWPWNRFCTDNSLFKPSQ